VQRAQLEHAIAVLIGQPPALFSLPAQPLTATPPAIPAGVPSELLERRPDIATAERLMASANAQIGIAKAAYYPTVLLTVQGGFESTDAADWLTWPMRFWSIGATVSETVYDAGLRRAQTDQARATFDADVAAYRQTVLTAFQAVEDNLAALRILADEARVQDTAVQLSERTTEVITNQYKAGTVTYLNVITAQTTELANKETAVTIRGSRMADTVLLIEALGGGWDAGSLWARADEP
jgi:NodT family efflux transporter outer membrane factor (OMF) lipoprotein